MQANCSTYSDLGARIVGRIRTVKPELFTHPELYQAEVETGLPLRLAYIGLWTVADREGRFKWKPETIELAVLPYDKIDFPRVLDALVTRGYLVHYASGGKEYGYLPTFKLHQCINGRESPSAIPDVSEGEVITHTSATRPAHDDDACPTRAPRVPHAPRGEGKGREGNKISSIADSQSSSALVEKPKAVVKKTDLSPEKLATYHAALEAFESSAKAKAMIFSSEATTGRELKALKEIVERAHNIAPESPAAFLAEAMKTYRTLVNTKLKGKASWIPSGLATGWIWSQVIESMKAAPTEHEGEMVAQAANLFARKAEA